jgi:2-polyprenyl-3-methyl-5-hydroxy-6-metoxy-1,4-benzoquinol methylase
MTATFWQQTRCVVCEAETRPLLDLGVQPLANTLLCDAAQGFQSFPLGLAVCPGCTHGQLTHFLHPDSLFRNYLYASGTSGTLTAYFAWFAAALSRCVRPGARVLEIASNDGSHLSCLAGRGFDVTGIDPAHNLNQIATAAGHKVFTGFFPDTRPDGRFDVVIAMNVVAHTPAPLRLLEGVAEALAPGGVAVIQTSQALMIGNGEFDTVYHEHYSFFTVASMRALAARAGLRLERVQLVSIHGVSLLFFLRRADETGPALPFAGEATFAARWPDPEPAYLSPEFGGALADAAYADFAAKARCSMTAVAARIVGHKALGKQIALVGVAAKALTFIRAAGIAPDLYLDEAPLKVGRLVPGASTPIEPLSSIPSLTRDTVFLIGAWNFAEELIGKIESFKRGFGSTFLIHFPQLREIGGGQHGQARGDLTFLQRGLSAALVAEAPPGDVRSRRAHRLELDGRVGRHLPAAGAELGCGSLRECPLRRDSVRLRGHEARGAVSRCLEDRPQHHRVSRGAGARPHGGDAGAP